METPQTYNAFILCRHHTAEDEPGVLPYCRNIKHILRFYLYFTQKVSPHMQKRFDNNVSNLFCMELVAGLEPATC